MDLRECVVNGNTERAACTRDSISLYTSTSTNK